MITDSARYYGAVFSFIIDRWTGSVAIRKACDDFAGFYIVNDNLPLFIKYSAHRKGPWTFTFQREHQEKQLYFSKIHGECIIAFVCGTDGIVALKHEDFRTVLDHFFESQESVTVRRRHNQMYQISGRDGELGRRVSRNSLAEVLQPMRSEVIVTS